MELIHEIRSRFAKEMFEFSRHAADQTILREIKVDEIRQAIKSGKSSKTIQMINRDPGACLLVFQNPAGQYTCNAVIHQAAEQNHYRVRA